MSTLRRMTAYATQMEVALRRIVALGCVLDIGQEESVFCKADGSAHSIYCPAGIAIKALILPARDHEKGE